MECANIKSDSISVEGEYAGRLYALPECCVRTLVILRSMAFSGDCCLETAFVDFWEELMYN